MTLTGFIEKETSTPPEIIAYQINSGAILNGVLQINELTNPAANKPARIMWDTDADTIMLETLTLPSDAVKAEVYAYGKQIFRTGSYQNNLRIRWTCWAFPP
ncbi:MAG: hypothetical protein LBT83_00415 [Tannerella sp.]|jgi:hypothetical protein|nr:hypothetical protein [Tannerella sp.]